MLADTMKRLALLSLSILLSFQLLAQVEGAVLSEADWEEALEKAEKEDKYIFVDGTTDWCVWCKRMEKTTFSDEEVKAQLAEDFVKLKMDMEYGFGQKLAMKHKVRGFPTFLVLDPEGKLRHRTGGFREPEDFMELLDKMADPEQHIDQEGVSTEIDPGFPDFYKKIYAPNGSDEKGYPDQETLQAFLEERDDKLSELSWAVMYSAPHALSEGHMEFFYENLEKYEERFGRTEVKTFFRRAIGTELRRTAEEGASWNVVADKLERYYVWDDREEFTQGMKMRWYQVNGDWENYGRMAVRKLQDEGVEGREAMANQLCWKISQKVEDPEILERATSMMEHVISSKPENYAYTDTYAHLLYKSGQPEKAKEVAKKAMELGERQEKETKGTAKLLEKIGGSEQ